MIEGNNGFYFIKEGKEENYLRVLKEVNEAAGMEGRSVEKKTKRSF